MENGIPRRKISTSLVLLFCIYFGSPGIAHAGPVQGCAAKYYEAARALDGNRANCGVSEDGQSAFCQTAARVNIPITIEGFTFTINIASTYRLLSSLKLIPNKFRSAAKLIQEAQTGSGNKLKRATKKIAKQIPGTTSADVSKVISAANLDGRLCAENHFLSVKEIREFTEYAIARQ
jgi:hypothetical protein